MLSPVNSAFNAVTSRREVWRRVGKRAVAVNLRSALVRQPKLRGMCMRKHSAGNPTHFKHLVFWTAAWALLSGVMFATVEAAQVIVYQERFETDGEGTRWTSIGRGVSEDPASGPAFWGLNYGPEAPSFVGVRAIAPARRAAMAWHHTIPAEA